VTLETGSSPTPRPDRLAESGPEAVPRVRGEGAR